MEPADIFVLVHATAPLLTIASIDEGVRAVRTGAHDSALSVVAKHDFFWTSEGPLNYDPANIPRTQDLEPIWLETSGFYAFASEVLRKHNRRVGFTPHLVEISEIEALDVDDADDFFLVDAVLARRANEQE